MMYTNNESDGGKGTPHLLLSLDNNGKKNNHSHNKKNSISNNSNNNSNINDISVGNSSSVPPTAQLPQKLVLPSGAGRAVPRTIMQSSINTKLKPKTVIAALRQGRPLPIEPSTTTNITTNIITTPAAAASSSSSSPPSRISDVLSGGGGGGRESKTEVQTKGTLVTSTSTNRTRLVQGKVKSTTTTPSPTSSSLLSTTPPTTGAVTVSETPSIFDEAPVEASLEYLTRPHRSWDSAVRTRELRMRKVQEQYRASTSRLTSTSSSLNSTQISTTTSPASERSLSRISFNSAPPTFGRAIAMSRALGSRTGTSSGVIRRGRLGMLPNNRTETEGLHVGGSRLLGQAALTTGVGFPTPLFTRQRPLPLGQTTSSLSVGSSVQTEGRGGGSDSNNHNSNSNSKGAVVRGGMREFAFSMQ
ncbi:hypothetical protein LSM04_003313 [Trypanosoma melophagium]|uniref:uncharacterized protein n=1 Tax=Trypanosoma melophagium TaxID=715481 RepID=UPI00351A2D1C|nr:hypothetical protein LSM04_003313 [Trypanosoma melophagium]